MFGHNSIAVKKPHLRSSKTCGHFIWAGSSTFPIWLMSLRQQKQHFQASTAKRPDQLKDKHLYSRNSVGGLHGNRLQEHHGSGRIHLRMHSIIFGASHHWQVTKWSGHCTCVHSSHRLVTRHTRRRSNELFLWLNQTRCHIRTECNSLNHHSVDEQIFYPQRFAIRTLLSSLLLPSRNQQQ